MWVTVTGGIGMSASALHRESTDSLIASVVGMNTCTPYDLVEFD